MIYYLVSLSSAQRATLMRIDSQGYASVIIPDHMDEMDCLTSGQMSCPFHASLDSLDQLQHPNDYEVPSTIRTLKTEATKRASLSVLGRQKAVSESEGTQEEFSSLAQTSEATTAGLVTVRVQRLTDKGSVESVHDLELANEEVFDSGFENSNEGLELTSPQMKGVGISAPPIPPRPPRPFSLSESRGEQLLPNAETHKRPRSRTFNCVKPPPQETAEKKLCIFLNKQSSVVV